MFHIICMGLGYEHESDFVIDRRDGYPHYLALLVRSKSRLEYQGEIRSYPPNTFILYDKNAPQFYAADGETYGIKVTYGEDAVLVAEVDNGSEENLIRAAYVREGTDYHILTSTDGGISWNEKLTISTSDPNIALALVKKEHAVVNVIGGSLNRSNLSLSGQMALQFVESTNIDIAFLSPSGFSLECGFTSGNYNESLLKKAIVEKARLVVMLLTSSKIRKAMPHTFAKLSDIHVFITDADPGEEIKKACEEAGVELIVAGQ